MEGTHVQLAAELAVGAELDVDALVEAEADQVQGLLHGAVLLRRHGAGDVRISGPGSDVDGEAGEGAGRAAAVESIAVGRKEQRRRTRAR